MVDLDEIRKRTLKLLRYDNGIRKTYGDCLCGVDEAGRGPLAGPVVASAVIFEKDTFINGVFDSKQVLKEQREELYEKIKKKCVSFGIGIIMHDKIDSVNILNATKLAMNKAIENLDIVPPLILADGNFYSNKISKVVNIIKGDAISFSIAAASIIAKVTRDRLMEKYENLYPNYSFGKHKGYATRQHIEEIKLNGYSDIHRKSFVVKSLTQLEIFEEDI